MSLVDTVSRGRTIRLPSADGLVQWIVPLAIILIWQSACATGFVSDRVLPAPTEVARAGLKLLLSGELGRNIGVSFWRAGVGFLMAAALDSLSGLPTAYRSFRAS